MSPRFVPRLLALAIPSLFPAAHAEDVQLPAVEVTATAVPEPAQSRLDAEALRGQTASNRDTARLLTELPGFSVMAGGAFSALPVFHGLADERLRLGVDGMDLYAACPNHMNTPLSYTDPAQIREIRVYSGIAPVSAGGDSLGPVVQIETFGPEFAAAGGRLAKGRVSAQYGSNANARGIQASAVLANDTLSLAYTGSANQADNYTAGDEFKTYDFTGRTGHTLPRDEVGSTAYRAVNHQLALGLTSGGHLLEAKVSYQDVPYQLYPNQRMDMLGNESTKLNLHYAGQFHWGRLDARLYHEKVDHYMDFGADKRYWYGTASGGGAALNGSPCSPIGTNCAAGMPMYTEAKTDGAKVQADIAVSPKDLLRVGAELHRFRLNDWWEPSGAGMWPNTFWNIRDGERDRVALFGEWEARLSPQWLTLAGLRYEHVTTDAGPVTGYIHALPPYGGTGGMGNQTRDAAIFNNSQRGRTFNNWDLTLLARYTPSANQEIEFGFAHKERAPSLYELYPWSTWQMAALMNNFVGDGNGYVGNLDLKKERADTLSATFGWHAANRAWEFRATPYYTRVRDYIDAVQWNATTNAPQTPLLSNQFTVLRYVNQDARLYGLDLSGNTLLSKTGVGEFGMKGLLSYTNGRNTDTGDRLYNIMPLNAKLTLTHKRGGWNNALEIVAVRRKNEVSAMRNEIRTPGYALVNLRMSHAWKQARVDFGIENLFDKLYYLPTGGAYVGQGTTMTNPPLPNYPQWGTAVPGMGRNFYAGITLDF